MVRVKICCIADRAEAAHAVNAGAFALGLVSRMPSGPGQLPEADIAAIAAGVPPAVSSVLLTNLRETDAIVAQHHRCRTSAIQFVGELPPGTLSATRERLPGISLIQVVHVTGPEALSKAALAGAEADALLLDSGNPALATQELGGTGRVHDWILSAEIVRASPVPVILAGGLNTQNVANAIRQVRPYAVDLCTGVRTEGALDGNKLKSFFAAVGHR